MVGRPKKDNTIIQIKKKVYYPTVILKQVLLSNKLNEGKKKQLRIFQENSIIYDNELSYIEEIYTIKTTSFGRLTPSIKNGKEIYNFSGANMKGSVRNLLFREYYVDTDFVNCHYVIANTLFEKHGLPNEYTKYYIENRDKCINEVIELAGGITKCNKYSAKALFLRICYGGKISNWSKDTLNEDCEEFKTGFYKNLENEIHSNIKKLIDETDEYYRNVKSYCQAIKDERKDTRDIYPATFSYICQDIERKCLMSMVEMFESLNYQVGCLIYDGCHIKSDKPIERYILEKVEKGILLKTCFPMKITVKDMFENDEEDEEYLKMDEVMLEKQKKQKELSYSEMKRKFEEKHFKVMKTGLFITIEKDSLTNCETIIKKSKNLFKTTYEHLKYIKIIEIKNKKGIVVDEEEKEESFIEKWFEDSDIKTYKDIQFIPPPLKCPDDIYNTWSSFVSENYEIQPELQEEAKNNLDTILNHLKLISGGYSYNGKYDSEYNLGLVENDEKDCFVYILKWICQLIQEPSKKSEVMLCLRSKLQGIGKTWLYCFLQSLLGSNLVCKIEDVGRDLFGTFNSTIDDKLFVFIDEICNKVWKKYYTNFLQTITEEETLINEKGVAKYKIKSYRRLFCASNSDTPLSIVKDERRIFAQDIKMENKPPAEYYIKLFNILKCKSSLRYIFDYFKQVDIKDYDPKKRPFTKFYEDLQEISIDPLVKFIFQKTVDLYNHPTYGGYLTNFNKKHFTNTLSDMKAEYVEFQTENYNKDFIIDSSVFGKKLKNLEFSGLIFTNPKNKSSYIFDIENIFKNLVEKRYMKQQDIDEIIKNASQTNLPQQGTSLERTGLGDERSGREARLSETATNVGTDPSDDLE